MRKHKQIEDVKQYAGRWDSINFLEFNKDVRSNCFTDELTMKDLITIYKELFNN